MTTVPAPQTTSPTLLRSDPAPLAAELRLRGFDLRRSTLVSFLVETGPDRAAAYAVRRAAAAAGWEASLYGDGTGWVVRLCRSRLPRPAVLERDRRAVERIATAAGATLRGMTVADPRTVDPWERLAARVSEPPPLPAQHNPRTARHNGAAATPRSA